MGSQAQRCASSNAEKLKSWEAEKLRSYKLTNWQASGSVQEENCVRVTKIGTTVFWHIEIDCDNHRSDGNDYYIVCAIFCLCDCDGFGIWHDNNLLPGCNDYFCDCVRPDKHPQLYLLSLDCPTFGWRSARLIFLVIFWFRNDDTFCGNKTIRFPFQLS